ncbi:phosphate ABC transporter permease PstA [Liquorilactobacillus capillatus]|uniref:Phosphate transport system permease protein PstA n=1 Tax=Liquorilactobacillus capillatus DSM 19910 TaxID=1423731 RepID=A0A0R1MF14_9LACO|nr:phosphate ABC transporter permease PstA [Liquorilactobacillus capillatus]KRL02907.1 phosphate ABC transporter permease [Liquorilactobacillus capillatus DSM 19910]
MRKRLSPQRLNRVFEIIIYIIVIFVVLILCSILSYIILGGVPYLSWHFLTASSSYVSVGGGIGVQLFNSLYLTILTLLISLPLAFGAGIWLAEYAPADWLTAIVRISLEVLSSLPSIVVGLFGFLLFVIKLHLGFSLLAGGLTLAFFNLPLLIRVTENAIKTVSTEQVNAGLALGISRWEVIKNIILPEAFPKIITGVILGTGRILGETAALIYTAGQSAALVDFNNWNPLSITSPLSPLRPAETVAVHIWKINSEGTMPDAAAVSAGSAAALLFIILFFDFSARWISNRYPNVKKR